ncbi:hypothetical protein [Noviherbaspirillum malthae]|uniref:hypothetical protein n=1 Tax=Noviherbaspirillum malthae TaxID=1260987 RepID=UPI0018900EB0|nr:hypothetical protein [Noviherbaspirillum malthae]
MGTSLGNYMRETVKQDVRLFLAPLVGAVKGIRQEVDRVQKQNASARKKFGA